MIKIIDFKSNFLFLLISFALLFLLFTQERIAISQEMDESEVESGESPESIIARDQYFATRRAGGPGMVLPVDAYDKAIYQRSLLPKDENILNSITSTVSWVSVNPIGMWYQRTNNNYVSGRTNSIAFHPTNPNIFYIAAAQGGVWKTTDGGATWTPLTDGLSTLTSGDIAVDQNNPNVIYYGTGEMNFSLDSQYGDGIHKTTNAGLNWVRVAGSQIVGNYISKICIHPTNSNIVYASGNQGVFKTTNAGVDWTNTGAPTGSTFLVMDPVNPQILYVATGNTSNGQIYKTTNNGTNWNLATNGLPASGKGRITLAISNINPLVLYASISNPSTSGLLGLYRTIDGGSAWTLQASSPNYLGGQGWYDNSICVKNGDPNTVIVGGIDVYSSTNGGVSLVQRSQWATTNPSNMTHADIHYLIYNGSVLYCCSDGGVYKSTNDGVTWTDLNHYLSTLQYQSADYDISNLQYMYGGCQDNDKENTTNGGSNWIQRTTGDGGYTVVDPVNTNYVYGQYVNGTIHRSANYGVSYSTITPSGSSGGLFYNPYEMAPGDHNTIVFGRADVWKTTNAQTATSGSGWTQIATTTVIGGNVSAIGISATNIDKIYIGTSNGKIFITSNNGANWNEQYGFNYVTDFEVDRTNDNVCYATFGGTSANRIMKTTNSGLNWINISADLPLIEVNAVVLRTTAPRMLIIGTDLGIFASSNDGANWVNFSTGFPSVAVYDLKYKQAPGIILAATHGRGCWTFNLGQMVGIDPNALIPDNYELKQNYPNPFNPSTKISFSLPQAENVKLKVFDILGKVVASLVDGRLNAGIHQLTWDASGTSSGVYFYKIEAGSFNDIKKMVLVK
ncbi:MAG: T9SS C-terminal target domain-containing protein [Ignavibacteriae bacterium]|nr:MAG: T9SS C-terminal target domain-containing protein [Ignavibacteriota bacterium]